MVGPRSPEREILCSKTLLKVKSKCSRFAIVSLGCQAGSCALSSPPPRLSRPHRLSTLNKGGCHGISPASGCSAGAVRSAIRGGASGSFRCGSRRVPRRSHDSKVRLGMKHGVHLHKCTEISFPPGTGAGRQCEGWWRGGIARRPPSSAPTAAGWAAASTASRY